MSPTPLSDSRGVAGLKFHDPRGTSGDAESPLPDAPRWEIATVTGRCLQSVRAILDTHDLARDLALGESAIRKIETAGLRCSVENRGMLKYQMAGGLGFEPRLTESESAVLPLNYPPIAMFSIT